MLFSFSVLCSDCNLSLPVVLKCCNLCTPKLHLPQIIWLRSQHGNFLFFSFLFCVCVLFVCFVLCISRRTKSERIRLSWEVTLQLVLENVTAPKNSVVSEVANQLNLVRFFHGFFFFILFSFTLFYFQKRKLQLSPEQCSIFYADQYGKMFFPNLAAYMSSGPSVAMILARHRAVSYWKELLGPSNSIKARMTHPHR